MVKFLRENLNLKYKMRLIKNTKNGFMAVHKIRK